MDRPTSTRDKIVKGVAALGVSNVVVRFISFFSVILTVRALSVYDYGIFTLFLSLTGPLNAFVSIGGMDDLLVADVSRSLAANDHSRAKSLMLHFFRLRLLLLLTALLAALLLRNVLEERYGESIVGFFWLFALLAAAQFVRNAYAVVFNVFEKFRVLSLINIFEVFSRFLLIAALFVLGRLDIQSLIATYIIGTAFGAAVFTGSIVGLWRKFSGVPLLGWRVVSDVLKRHGKWQIASELLSSPAGAIRYWLIKVFVSVEAIGLLSLAQSLFSALASLVPLRAVVLPIAAKKAHDKPFLNTLLQKLTKYSLAISAVILLGAQAVLVPIVPFAFPKYTMAIPLFQVLSFRLLFNSTSITQSAALTIYRRQKLFIFTGFAIFLSVLIFSPPLLMLFGVMGAVAESFIEITVITAFREWYLRRKVGVSTIGVRALLRIDEMDRLILREFREKLNNALLWRKRYS